MKMTTEEFIASFHSLTGTTVGERQKNFNFLLNTMREHQHAEIDFSLLHPKTPLEEKLKVDALIYFKRLPEMLDMLKSENPILIERILKGSSSPWFIQETFQNITGEDLVNSIFPYISFNAKVKLLNKLALNLRNSEKADEYFKYVDEKYGFYLASKLIPCCSLDVVMKCIKFNRLKVMPKHLLLIIKKQPDVTESLLKQLKDTGRVDLAEEYENVFKYLSEVNPALFLKLQEEYKTSIRLGWRITDKYILKNKETIIKDPEYYYNILHKKQIAKSLKQDFQRFYFNMFPSSYNRFSSCYLTLFGMCQYLPQNICNVYLFLETFKKAYGFNLWEQSGSDTTDTNLNTSLLDMLSKKYREKIVKIESRPSYIPEEQWYIYMTTQVSIPYLKKAILLSSAIKTRVELVQLLVKTCKINEDEKALADICTYMVTKHRNDHTSVRAGFLKTVKMFFNLGDLGEQHWEPINELIELFNLNEELFYQATDFAVDYICYKLKNNMDIKEELKKYMKTTMDYNIIKENPEYEKKCLLLFGDLLSQMYDESEIKDRMIAYLNCIVNWNKRHPEDEIDISNYKEALNRVKSILTDEKNVNMYQLENVVDFCIFNLNAESQERSEIMKSYLREKNSNSHVLKIIGYLLKKEPLTIREDIQNITKLLLINYHLRNNTNIWNSCSNLTHLEIPQEIIKFCTASAETQLEESYYENVISNSISALAYLMSNQEFNDFIKKYHPTDLTAASKTKEKQIYAIQQNIGKNLKHIKPASSALEVISIFCKGDYLKLVRSSLYSICNNVNEDKLPPFFNELSKRAVSVRKHALHLTVRVLDKEHVLGVLKKFMYTEKNASVRKFIFKSIFDFFAHNPSDHTWEIFQSNMKAVDVKDNEAIEILLQVDKIPHKYFVKYIIFTWDILDNAPDSQNVKESRFSTLLGSIKLEQINLIPKDYCQKIIDAYFLKNITGLTMYQSVVNTFVCKYIIYCDNEPEQEFRLNSVFKIIKDCTSNKSSDIEKWAILWNYVSDVLKEFCKVYLSNKCTNVRILKRFAELWKNSFPLQKAVSEYLHLEFTLIFVENLPLVETGRKMAKLCDELVNVFGNIIVPIFSKKIIFFYNYFLPEEDTKLEKIDLIESLLLPNPSIACLILIIMLLDDDYNIQYINKTEAQYQKLVGVLEKETDPAVQVYYNNHIRYSTTLDYH